MNLNNNITPRPPSLLFPSHMTIASTPHHVTPHHVNSNHMLPPALMENDGLPPYSNHVTNPNLPATVLMIKPVNFFEKNFFFSFEITKEKKKNYFLLLTKK
jgi:hypothetical protein